MSGSITIIAASGCSASTNYYYTLEFVAGDESIRSSQYIMPRAFASLHIAECTTGGVAIGGFSTASENNPKFEVHHPSYFKQPV